MAIDVTVTYDGSNITSLSNQSSVAVAYGGSTLFTLSAAGTKTLNCKDKMMSTNVTVGSKTLSCKDKIMKTNVVVKATTTPLYLIKNGTLQGNYAITLKGLKPSSSTSIQNAANPVRTNNSGNIQIEARGSGTYTGAGIAYVSTKINLSGYSTVHITGKAKNATGNNNYLALAAWTSIGSYWDSNRTTYQNVLSSSTSSYTTVDISMSVSSITSSNYIGICVARYNSQSSGFQIVNLYLD